MSMWLRCTSEVGREKRGVCPRRSTLTLDPAEGEMGERRLMAFLGAIAGMVDVSGWLTLGGLFTAHITGNLVIMAADTVEARTVRLALVAAVPAFMMVAVTVAFAVRALRLRPVRIERSLLGLQSLLLVAAAILASATRPSGHPTGSAACVVAMIAVVAMASQNVMLHLTRDRAPTTAVMTGNLVVATLALVVLLTTPAPDRAAARTQWTHSWPILAGFIVGCLAGAASIRIWSDNGWFAPAIASVVLATWRRFRPPASEAALASISGRAGMS